MFLSMAFSYIPLFLFQVETVAQFGVIFLLFALGLEFSTAKVFYLHFFPHSVGNTMCDLKSTVLFLHCLSFELSVLLLFSEDCFKLCCSCFFVAFWLQWVSSLLSALWYIFWSCLVMFCQPSYHSLFDGNIGTYYSVYCMS